MKSFINLTTVLIFILFSLTILLSIENIVWIFTSLCLLIIFLMMIGIKRLIDKIEFYEEWYVAFKNRISVAREQLDLIDASGAFESDDEVGNTFKTIHDIFDDVNRIVE